MKKISERIRGPRLTYENTVVLKILEEDPRRSCIKRLITVNEAKRYTESTALANLCRYVYI